MSKHELLNNIDHKNVKILTERSAKYGDDIWFVPTFWREFRSVQSSYPILFQRNDEQDTYIPMAFFGFQKNENLFLVDKEWDSAYIPLSVQRLPFYIGFQQKSGDKTAEQRVITIDMDSPRVNTEEGVPLFLEYGGNSDFLERIANILETLHEGVQDNHEFVKTLIDLELLEPVTLDITLNDGSEHHMIGFHTINETKVNELDHEILKDLHQKNYLSSIFAAIFSQIKFGDLIRRKNKLIAR